MQISGEPLATAMGRDLAATAATRCRPTSTSIPTRVYWIDLPGFSTGVESYEYSKQPMNELAFESRRRHVARRTGRSSIPTTRPARRRSRGSRALDQRLRGLLDRGRHVRVPRTNPMGAFAGQPLGWPGIWPTHARVRAVRSGDRSDERERRCMLDQRPTTSRRSSASALVVRRLRVRRVDAAPARSRDADRSTITPGADGFAAWKYGLWVMNYLQIMHDVDRGRGRDASTTGRARVRRHARQSDHRRRCDGRADGRRNVSRLERHRGLSGANVHRELDNRADDWLPQLRDHRRHDARQASRAGRAALAYDYAAPLRGSRRRSR